MWKRSSKCEGGHCLEVAQDSNIVILRNNIDPRQVVATTREEWKAFVEGVKAGEFD